MTPKFVPTPTPETLAFWEGTARNELRLPKCVDCDRPFFYPRAACPSCGGTNLVWIRCSGAASLYSYVISHVVAKGFEDEMPVVIAIVELEEGPRMLTNVVDVEPDPEHLQLDMPLEVTFVARGPVFLPLFRPWTAKGAS